MIDTRWVLYWQKALNNLSAKSTGNPPFHSKHTPSGTLYTSSSVLCSPAQQTLCLPCWPHLARKHPPETQHSKYQHLKLCLEMLCSLIIGTGRGSFRSTWSLSSHCCSKTPTKSFPWSLIGVSWAFCYKNRDLEIYPLKWPTSCDNF